MNQRQHRQPSAALETASWMRCDMCLGPGLELRETVVVVGLQELAPKWLCDACIATADGRDPFVHIEVLPGRRVHAA